jgi:hypothetical protein
MTSPLASRLRQFACELLDRHGGLVEWPEHSPEGMALLPAEAASALGLGETVRLSQEPGGEGLTANLATDFLERTGALLAAQPRVGLIHIPEAYLKKADMAGPVAKAFTWLNAKVVVETAEPQRVEYQTWYLLACLESEDQWQELLRVTINTDSGAEVAMDDPTNMAPMALYAPPADSCAWPDPPSCFGQVLRISGRIAAERSGPFVQRQEGRLRRDRERLRQYYGALLRQERSSRSKEPLDPEKEQERRRAVQLELQRKLAELEDRYVLRASLTPVALVRLQMPALAVRCKVFRRKAWRRVSLYWNPLTKAMEPLCCSACAQSTFSAAFTDETVLPLCPACAKVAAKSGPAKGS